MSPRNCLGWHVLLFCAVLTDLCSALFCRSNGLFEHPTDCRKFFSCTPTGPVLMHCPAGLHFSPQIHVCDWPDNAGCKSDRLDEEHATQKCPIYRHPTDCSKFYICSPLGHILLHCPFGLKFNSQLSVCDWPANVQCSQPVTASTEQIEETTASGTTIQSSGGFSTESHGNELLAASSSTTSAAWGEETKEPTDQLEETTAGHPEMTTIECPGSTTGEQSTAYAGGGLIEGETTLSEADLVTTGTVLAETTTQFGSEAEGAASGTTMS